MNIASSIRGFLRYNNLLNELVKRDIKLRYRRSFLGYLWSVLNPLMIMMVMSVVFSRMFRFEIPHYPVYLLAGQILFNYNSEATNNAMSSITGSGALLKKTYVPKYIFTVSKVISAFVNLLFSLAALVLVILITGAPFHWQMLLFPLVILQLFVFSLGLGLFLAQLVVFFRDVQYIYSVVLTAWTYLTPIFYPESVLGEGTALLWAVQHFNPLYSYIAQFRSLVLDGVFPSWNIVSIGILWAVGFLLLGMFSFYKQQDKFILYI